MKRKIFFGGLLAAICCLQACYKDLGNYSYKQVNKVIIAGIDTVKGYSIFLGDSLSVLPDLNYTLDANAQHQYSYEWSWYSQDGDVVISKQKDLHTRVTRAPGAYSLQYRVKDETTGIIFHAKANVVVRTDVYEGYLVLSDVGGSSRLDMLSYDAVSGKFAQITDVLAKKGSSLPPQGAPYKVLATRVSSAFNYSDSTYGIYLVTASGTNRVNPETFDYNPTYNIRYEIAGTIAQDFKADNMIADPATYFISIYMISDGNVYYRTGGVPMYGLPINKYAGLPLFRASKYIVSDGSGHAVLYNMDDRKFAVTNSTNGTMVQDPPHAGAGEIDFPTGGDLVFMDKSASGYGYAITRMPGTSDFTLTKFLPGSLPTYVRPIKAVDIDKATLFAFSANPEYLFYVVGGKVYEYDLSLGTSKLMLDKGSMVISYLACQRFTATIRNPTTYGQWAKWLTIGVYDPAGNVSSAGTIEQYSIKDANEPLTLQTSWTGFGKIVSMSYRER